MLPPGGGPSNLRLFKPPGARSDLIGRTEPVLQPAETQAMIYSILIQRQRERLESEQELDCAHAPPGLASRPGEQPRPPAPGGGATACRPWTSPWPTWSAAATSPTTRRWSAATEKEVALRGGIRSAMTYPVVVFVIKDDVNSGTTYATGTTCTATAATSATFGSKW
jgi:hypothetical protein